MSIDIKSFLKNTDLPDEYEATIIHVQMGKSDAAIFKDIPFCKWLNENNKTQAVLVFELTNPLGKDEKSVNITLGATSHRRIIRKIGEKYSKIANGAKIRVNKNKKGFYQIKV